jgi:signal peptidase II
MRRLHGLIALVLGTTGCDQVTKWQATARLASGPVNVLDGLWRFAYVENPGASWNILRDAPEPWRSGILLCTSFAVMLLLVVWLRRSAGEPWRAAALALVLGGALGNFIDRLRLGYVVDFIQWHWFDRAYFPVFNVADVAITIGVGMLLVVDAVARRRRAAPSD